MTRIRIVTLLMPLLFIFAPLAPAHAQDAPTPEVTPPAATATLQPAPNVTVNNYPTTDPSVTPQTGESPVTLTLLLIGSFLVGGAAVGTPLTYLLLNMTKAQKDTAEKLFLSQPPANIEKERAVIDVLDKAVTFLGKLLGVVKEVTDGLPNTDTPPASGSNSG